MFTTLHLGALSIVENDFKFKYFSSINFDGNDCNGGKLYYTRNMENYRNVSRFLLRVEAGFFYPSVMPYMA